MSTWTVPVWTEMKGWIKRRGWLMHLAHWSMQTQMCPKYLMQTIPASHYPEKLSTAWGSCQVFFPLPFSHSPLSSHTDKPKNTCLTDTHRNTHYDRPSHPRWLQFWKLAQLPAVRSSELLWKQTRTFRKRARSEKDSQAWLSLEPTACPHFIDPFADFPERGLPLSGVPVFDFQSSTLCLTLQPEPGKKHSLL